MPETSNHELPSKAEQQNSPEVALTPEKLQEKILKEVLERYGVDLKQYSSDLESFRLANYELKRQTTGEELFIQQQARELYQNYVESQLQKGNVEKVVNLDTLSHSIGSDRIQALKEEIEPILDTSLEKYTFLDTQTKNFVKLGFINSLLKSPVAQIGESLIGGVGKYIEKLTRIDSNNIKSISDAFKETPEDSGRTLALEEEFAKKWSSYIQKFDEIQEKFKKENITNQTEQQNILSHIEWFRNPVLIENGAHGLDVSKIDMSKREKNDTPLDTKKLAEYMVNSREKIIDLSNKLNLGDKSADSVYNLINNGGKIGEYGQKIVETLLKIPFLGKFLAIFLGLSTDPEKAIGELRDNTSNFKILSSFKSLGITKDENGKEKPGQSPFEKLDFSALSFNSVKKEISSLKPFLPDGKQDEESMQNFWLQAFGKGVQKGGIILKFELGEKKEGKLTSSELKDIFKKGIGNYNQEKEKKETEADTAKKAEEQSQLNTQITQLNSSKDTLNSQIDTISSLINKDYEKVRHWDDVFNIGDINDIKTQDIINHNGDDFNSVIESMLKTGSLKDLTKENLALINSLFSYIKEYCKEKNLSNQGEIKDFLKNNEIGFHSWLELKKTEFTKQKDGKRDELATLQGNQEKLDFTKNIGEKIQNAPDGTSLGNAIDLGGDKKLSFHKDSQELNIGDEKFKIELNSKGEKYNLKDIKITSGKVEFIPDIEDWKLTAARKLNPELGFVSKEKVINGITDLVTKGTFTYEKDKTKLSFSKVQEEVKKS